MVDSDKSIGQIENVEVISPIEVYLRKVDGTVEKRICGCVKSDGKRCLSPAGAGTDHIGVGLCCYHEKGVIAKKGWLQMVAESAKSTTLGDLLDKNSDLEVSIGEVTEEIKLQQILILSFVQTVLKDREEFTKEDIKFLKELNLDMIHSKESAARIKGSMKLDAITVKQFANQILTFLFSRLVNMVGKAEAYKLAADMNKEVFAPMIARSLISGEVSQLQVLPDSLKDMRIAKEMDAE